LDRLPLLALDLEKVQKRARRKQAVALDRWPGSRLGHVVQTRPALGYVGGAQLLRDAHHWRRSMIPRWRMKPVEISETLAPVTLSISSMNSIVSSVSCSKRQAFAFSAPR